MRLILFVLFFSGTFLTFSQVKLTSFPLELKKSKVYHQFFSASDKQNGNVFVFATDKEKTTIVKYSPFLFLKDSMVTPRPDLGYKIMAGYSIGPDDNPTLYWADPMYKKILGVQYDLVSKKTTYSFLQLPLDRETVLQTFNENNNFYVLTKKINADALVLYVFKEGKRTPYLLDFSGFEFVDNKKEVIDFTSILTLFPLEKIETQAYNPLFKAISKSKIYVRENDILFTFDHNTFETRLFQLDFKTLQLIERNFAQFPLKPSKGNSNSYYHEGKIYQLSANKEELHFGFKDFQTGALLHEYSVTKNDTITFKNSPLFSHVDNRRPRTIKTTTKFLAELSLTSIGVTVYKTPWNLFFTIGGNRGLEQLAFPFMSIDGEFIMDYNFVPMSVYFESIFDKKLNHSKSRPGPLAVDYINRFTFEHPYVVLQNTFRHKNYYLHAYYDSKLKQFVLLKFNDGQ